MNEEIKAKLKKLEEYEAEEREKEMWQPHVELEKELSHMYECRRTLEQAAFHQDEAEDISVEFNLDLQTYGRACIWDALTALEKQIEAKENESEKLYLKLTEDNLE